MFIPVLLSFAAKSLICASTTPALMLTVGAGYGLYKSSSKSNESENDDFKPDFSGYEVVYLD